MSSAEQPSESFEAVVSDAGDVIISAEQVAGLGLHPGEHLAVVLPLERPKRAHRTSMGLLADADLGPVPTWEDFKATSREVAAEVEAAAERKARTYDPR